MNTKVVDAIMINKKNFTEKLPSIFNRFLEFDTDTFLEGVFQTGTQLSDERWVVMEDDSVYDINTNACWYGLKDKKCGSDYESTCETFEDVLNVVKQTFNLNKEIDLPTLEELNELCTSLYDNNNAFKAKRSQPEHYSNYTDFFLYLIQEKLYVLPIDGFSFVEKDSLEGISWQAFPLVRLLEKNAFQRISLRTVFFLWIAHKFTPIALKDNKIYKSLIEDYSYDFRITEKGDIVITRIELIGKLSFILTDYLKELLLEEDTKRANITPYHSRMLEDINQGHWNLWDTPTSNTSKNLHLVYVPKLNLVARDPASDIANGVVGIDFGTKSTIVAYQKDSVKIHPMRIGAGDQLNKSISSSHYENPTIMQCINLEDFIEAYNATEFRPSTKWNDLTISHTAVSSRKGASSNDFSSFLSELKQWAGDKNKKIKIMDKNHYLKDIPSFLNLQDNDFNPIEVYAYYIGLNINNQHNGIYLNYILSFPVTYEKSVREKILESFKRGIKKSLPQTLESQYVEMLSVESGSSEPAAYSIIALEEYGFEPSSDERFFYGVFDFGGGTTDFDFGIYREAGDTGKERRFDYVLEHFGAGGDRFLGGENLIELMAFEVFKKNKDKLLASSIQFEKHAERDMFAGGEMLLSSSREARMNTKVLAEELRPFWEEASDAKNRYSTGSIKINLTDIDGTIIPAFELDISDEELLDILRKRIQKGVFAFFEQLRIAFTKIKKLDDIEKINIFLAGNSSKSSVLKYLFEEEIKNETIRIKGEDANEEIFQLFQPLDGQGDIEKPTGKTGVAFGLIKSRKGGKLLIVDHNITEDIPFKYYLGHSKKNKFKVILDRETEYNKWINFIDASINQFEVFYTTSPIASTNSLTIDDHGIKKLLLHINHVSDEDEVNVYIRFINPTEFEYVVARESELKNETYLSEIKKVSLD